MVVSDQLLLDVLCVDLSPNVSVTLSVMLWGTCWLISSLDTVCTSVGAEAAVHAARTYLHSMSDDYLLLKVDFSNVFNSIRRDMMLQACLQYTPEIYPLVHSAYAIRSYLFLGKVSLNLLKGLNREILLALFCSV